MKNLIKILGFILLSHALWAQDIYKFQSIKQEAQFEHLLKELRCLVCQNQDLSDSNAPLALDLKKEIYEKVYQGESDEAIIRYLTQRYGDFILFKPPVKRLTYLLWGAPLVFVIIGIAIFWRLTRKYAYRVYHDSTH